MKTLHILKMLYTVCFSKEAISLLLSQSMWSFKKNLLLHMHFGLIVANENKKKLESGHFTS